jgi:RimJ/RimL family protein N-acetyltransferase
MTYRLIALPVPALTALVDGRLDDAVAASGAPLTPFFLDQAWLWRIRLRQLDAEPADAEWIARAALCQDGPDAGAVVGHIGCHGAPDDSGVVEVGYSVDPAFRRRGHAKAMLAQELERLDRDPRVQVVRVAIAPTNAASLGTIAGLGFTHVGEQWDEEDGLELVWDRPAGRGQAD